MQRHRHIAVFLLATLVLGGVVAPTSHFVYMAASDAYVPMHHGTHAAPASDVPTAPGIHAAPAPHTFCTYAALFAHPLPSTLGTPAAVTAPPARGLVLLPAHDRLHAGPAHRLLPARAPPRA